MPRPKKTIAVQQEQSEAVAKTPAVDKTLEERYKEMSAAMELLKKQLEASGAKLESPPDEPGMVKIPTASEAAFPPLPESIKRKHRPGEVVNGVPIPWTKADLAEQEKYHVVPQWIPGAVHPIPDRNGKYYIFLSVNGLQCALQVWENNVVSGMFYHAYKNIEENWLKGETYKKKGPEEGAIWVTGGLNGINTWYYQPEAPAAWINLDGGYYKPGDEMPTELVPEIRPS